MEPVSLPFSRTEIFDEGAPRQALETTVLPSYVPRCRWFGGKARGPERFRIEELVTLDDDPGATAPRIALVRVEYADGSGEMYALPLCVLPLGEGAPPHSAMLARLTDDCGLFDAIHSPEFRAGILRIMASQRNTRGTHGELAGTAGEILGDDAVKFESRVLQVEQSNSAMIFRDSGGQDRLFVKLFRKLEEGVNPDVEITRFLSERQHFPHVPPFGGAVEYRKTSAEPRVVALALGMVPNDGDAWAFTLREVEAFYTRVRESGAAVPEFHSPGLWDRSEEPPQMLAFMQTFVARAWQLGVRTAQMHLALAAAADEPAFAPEPLTQTDQHDLAEELRRSGQNLWALLSSPATREYVTARELADFQPLEAEILARAEALERQNVHATKSRTHGDYHLGQVLNTGEDFVIIDFEGEPLRPLAERKAKRSPLRDVAGMLRSFHYAAHSGLGQADDAAHLLPWAEAWAATTSRTFLRAWLETVDIAPIVPKSEAELRLLLEGFLLEKALYEVSYELNNRPSWVGIPLRGIAAVLGN